MEAIFFVAMPAEAAGVLSVLDLEDEPATEPIVIRSPSALIALTTVLDQQDQESPGKSDRRGGLEQLHDATCQSFPVWSLSRPLTEVLARLETDAVDAMASRWRDEAGDEEIDGDLFELSSCLSDLRRAAAACRESGQKLFVLLEEKAI